MRVELVVAALEPSGGSPAARRALQQASALVERGCDVCVVTASASAADLELAQEQGFEIRRLAMAPGTGLEPASAPEDVVAELAAADLVHLHLGQPLFSDLVRRLAPRTKVCLELDDWHSVCARGDRLPPAQRSSCPSDGDMTVCAACLAPESPADVHERLAERLALRASELSAEVAAAARVLVPSRTHLVRLADLLEFDPARVRIVSPHQGRGPAARLAPRAPWRGDGPLRLLYSGPRSTRAGLIDLVRGLAVLQEGRVQLVLVGQEAEQGLDDRLRALAGSLSLEFGRAAGPMELRRQAARCHLAVLPSRASEGDPGGVAAALALGLPILACHAEAAAERYGNEGLEQLPPRDPNAWTTRIGEFLRRPRELAELSAGMPTEIPGPAETAERLHSLYLNLSGPGRSRAS